MRRLSDQAPLLHVIFLLCLYLCTAAAAWEYLPYTELFAVDPACPALTTQWTYTTTMLLSSQHLYGVLADRGSIRQHDEFRMKNAHLVTGFSSFDYYGRVLR